MALTAEQQAQLDELQAEAAKPEPRTETGVAGVLHQLIDIASGAVAHLGPEAWAELHRQAESLGGGEPAADKPTAKKTGTGSGGGGGAGFIRGAGGAVAGGAGLTG